MKTRDISRTGLLTALAMVLSYIESIVPAFVAIPGIKMGLANITVVFALYTMGTGKAVIVSLVRVVLSSLLFGSVLSLAYSLSGAVVSLAGMCLLKKTNLFSPVAVSTAGGVLHNLAQVGTACLILETSSIAYYIPFLIVSGTVSGIVIGTVGAIIIKRNSDEESEG